MEQHGQNMEDKAGMMFENWDSRWTMLYSEKSTVLNRSTVLETIITLGSGQFFC